MPAKKEKSESSKKTKSTADKSLSVPKRMKPTHEKRQRKEIQRFTEDTSESTRGGSTPEPTIKKGKGKKLQDITNVVANINKRGKTDDLLRMLHGLLIGRVNKKTSVKSNLKEFSGIIYDDDKGRERLEGKLERHKLRELRDIARFFGQDDKGEREDLVKVIADFLEKPAPSDRTYSSPKKAASSKRKRSASPKKSSSKKSSSKKSSGGEKKTKRRKKDPNEPKRPLSAYMFYCQDHRNEVKEKLGKDAPVTEVARKLGKLWAKVSEDDKKKYEKKHQKAKEQYEKDMKKYKKEDK